MSTEQVHDLDWSEASMTPEQVVAEINRVSGTIGQIMTKWLAKLTEVRALIVRLKEQHAEQIADAENLNSQQAERIRHLENVAHTALHDLQRVRHLDDLRDLQHEVDMVIWVLQRA